MERKSNREFYISSLSIKYLRDSDIIHICSENVFPKDIHNLITEAFYIYKQREGREITTQPNYNFSVDMLKGLRN